MTNKVFKTIKTCVCTFIGSTNSNTHVVRRHRKARLPWAIVIHDARTWVIVVGFTLRPFLSYPGLGEQTLLSSSLIIHLQHFPPTTPVSEETCLTASPPTLPFIWRLSTRKVTLSCKALLLSCLILPFGIVNVHDWNVSVDENGMYIVTGIHFQFYVFSVKIYVYVSNVFTSNVLISEYDSYKETRKLGWNIPDW